MSEFTQLVRGTSILDEIVSLSSLGFLQDAKIVCQDGSVRWSALLLSQWSDLARKHLLQQNGFVCEALPLTLILPQANVETMQKLLHWSIQGEIVATAYEAFEISTVLYILEADVSFSQAPHFEKNHKKVQPSVHLPDRNMAVAVAKDVRAPKDKQALKQSAVDQTANDQAKGCGTMSAQSQNTDVADKSQSNLDGRASKKPVSCPLCGYVFDRSSNLVNHLCTVHYGEDLLQVYGGLSAKSCPVCGKIIIRCETSFRAKICSHVGVGHGYLFTMPSVSPKVKHLFPKRQHYRKGGSDVSKKLSKFFRDCNVCRNGCLEYSSITAHLAQIHYSKALMAHFDRKTNKCKVCSAKVEVKHGGKSFCAIRHLTDKHPDAFLKLLPREIFEELTNKSSEDALACPVCSKCFKKSSVLKNHLCGTHFKQELLGRFNSNNTKTCQTCGMTSVARADVREFSMARHVGLTHGKLRHVLPKEMLLGLKSKVAHVSRPKTNFSGGGNAETLPERTGEDRPDVKSLPEMSGEHKPDVKYRNMAVSADQALRSIGEPVNLSTAKKATDSSSERKASWSGDEMFANTFDDIDMIDLSQEDD